MSHKEFVNSRMIGLLVISIVVATIYTLEPIMAVNNNLPDVIIDDPPPDDTPPGDPPDDTKIPTPTAISLTPTIPTPTIVTPTVTPTPTVTTTPNSSTPTPTITTYNPSHSEISESDNSGNGGILSIVSKDASENLLKSEIVENNLVANKSIKYSFTMPEFAIYEVMINDQNNENQIPVKIEHLQNTSKYAPGPVPGIVYRNENIWIGTKRINYISVKFRVKNSWFKENNLNESIIPYLSKWNGTTWLILKTNMTGKDETYTYFETPKAGASPLGVFAIGVISRRTVSVQPTSTVKTQPTIEEPTEEIVNPEIIEVTPEKTSGFGDMVLITSMILMLTYVIMKRYE